MNLKSIAEGIAATVDDERIIADDDEVWFCRDDGPGPSDLLLLSDHEGRGLGAYRVVVEPVGRHVAMDFSAALHAVKAGACIARDGWDEKGMHVRLERIQLVVFGVATFLAGGEPVPWVASQTDVLAEDWTVVVPARRGSL